MKVLIAEDDNSVSRFLLQAVTEAGYAAQCAIDGPTALENALTGLNDLILLDVMLPGMDGFEICRRIRSARISTPIMMITARDATEDKIAGLDCGADDYIVKPFQLGELLARMRALLRRGEATFARIEVADLSLDPSNRRVTRGGKVVALSVTEFSLLEYLMRNAGRVVTRSMILDHVWQYDFDGNDNVLDVYISYLRSKIDRTHSPLIHTVRGVGYRLEALENRHDI